MKKPAEPNMQTSDDYRASHLQRGSSYDATLSAGPFDTYMAQREQAMLGEIVPALFPQQKPRYLDFACGTGRITGGVAPMCADATGVDISPSMLDEARRKFPAVKFVHADLTQAQVDLGQFDLITSFRFFGNAQQDLRVAVLRTLHRLLRPSGRLIINSHRNPHALAQLFNSLSGGSASGMDLSYFKLKSLLRECGFEIETIRPIATWMYRFKLQATTPDAARAAQLEKTFGSALFAPIAPDAIVVARKVA